jgi:O-antigen ligase
MLILIAASLLSFLTISLLLVSSFNGVWFLLVSKSTIDASWAFPFIGGQSWLRIIGVFVPLILLPKIFLFSKKRLKDFSLVIPAFLFLTYSMFSVAGLAASETMLATMNNFFRVLNGFLAFFMFQHFFSEKDAFKALLHALLLAGIFPVLVALYQMATGQVLTDEVRAAAGLVRNNGFYHDSFNVRYYGFQTLAGILLYISYFCKSAVFRMLLLAYAVACSLTIFYTYSKAGVAIFIIWVFVWVIFNKKFSWLIAVPIFLVVANIATDNMLVERSLQVFSKEIGAHIGTVDDKKVLSGRLDMWGHYIDQWADSGVIGQLFGTGLGQSAHSEFVRVLVSCGIVGFILFLVMYALVGMKIALNFLQKATPLSVMGCMLFLMLLIDSVGLVPSQFPAYQWFVIGLMSLSIGGVEGLDGKTKDAAG